MENKQHNAVNNQFSGSLPSVDVFVFGKYQFMTCNCLCFLSLRLVSFACGGVRSH